MNITLYTLPNCPICEMAKTKLNNKNISYTEKDFAEIASTIQSDHAPALKIEENGETRIINNPSGISRWINCQV